jgi:hypothetical protein
VIVAPPDGDGLSLGTKARFQLSEILAYLRPRAVLGLGNQALESALKAVADMGSLKRGSVSGAVPWGETTTPDAPAPARAESGHTRTPLIRCLPGVLGDPPNDLRVVLAEGVRLCAGLPPGSEGGS